MALLDGTEVRVGDTLWSVAEGRGRVTQLLTEGRVLIEFEVGGRTVTFDGLGIRARGTHRTLFWKNPIIAIPSKDDALWDRLRPVITAVVAAFRAHPPVV